MASSSKVRSILLVGSGSWRLIHLTAYTKSRRWKVSALASTRNESLKALRYNPSLRQTIIYKDPIKAINSGNYDAVAVIVGNPYRVPILLKALETGAPVLTEKPLVHSLKDLQAVYRAAGKSQAPLMVSQNYRFEPQIRRLNTFLQEKKSWGELQSISVRFARSVRKMRGHYVMSLPNGLGLNAEMCVHHYDLLRYLLGTNPLTVRATAHRASDSPMAGWGSIHAWLEFPGNVFVDYDATFDVSNDLTDWGGDWDFHFRDGSLTAYPFADGRRPIELHARWKGRWKLQTPSTLPKKGYHPCYLVDKALQEFTNALDENRLPECHLRDNAQTMAIMLAIDEAVRTGNTVSFPKFLEKVLKGCPS